MTELRVAYLGPPGTYSHQAAIQQFEALDESKDTTVVYMPQPSISACFQSIADNKCDYSLVPFENSTNGQVVLTYDLFRDWYIRKEQKPEFNVVGEQFVHIHHNLISRASDLSQIRLLYSHPQAWGQCGKFLQELDKIVGHKVDRLDVSSTSKGVYMLDHVPDEDKYHVAAIGSATASEIHGVPIQRDQIEDLSGNMTRFLVLGREPVPEAASGTATEKKMTFMAFTIKEFDDFGSLCDILAVFKAHNLNLQTITTRPSVSKPWHYVFFVELWYQEKLPGALADLCKFTLDREVIGTFKRAKKFFEMTGTDVQ